MYYIIHYHIYTLLCYVLLGVGMCIIIYYKLFYRGSSSRSTDKYMSKIDWSVYLVVVVVVVVVVV